MENYWRNIFLNYNDAVYIINELVFRIQTDNDNDFYTKWIDQLKNTQIYNNPFEFRFLFDDNNLYINVIKNYNNKFTYHVSNNHESYIMHHIVNREEAEQRAVERMFCLIQKNFLKNKENKEITTNTE